MSNGRPLVCFAVKEEAAAFRKSPAAARTQILLTGMGKTNAGKSIRDALGKSRPALVLTCGFAGGLNPALVTGDALFSTDDSAFRNRLLAAGAREGIFFCAERVVVTVEEKRALRQAAGADAVEMESQVICEICRKQQIPSATVRVILDPADEGLPLDFNSLMTPDLKLDAGKLALAVAKSPGKIGALLRLQKQTMAAAKKLAAVLEVVVA